MPRRSCDVGKWRAGPNFLEYLQSESIRDFHWMRPSGRSWELCGLPYERITRPRASAGRVPKVGAADPRPVPAEGQTERYPSLAAVLHGRKARVSIFEFRMAIVTRRREAQQTTHILNPQDWLSGNASPLHH